MGKRFLARCFATVFKEEVWINKPYRGGYITRSHSVEMPWLQLEISQTDAYSNTFMKNCVEFLQGSTQVQQRKKLEYPRH